MIFRALVLFVVFAGAIYLGIGLLANTTLTAAKALKVVKTAGAIFLSLVVAAVLLAITISLDKSI